MFDKVPVDGHVIRVSILTSVRLFGCALYCILSFPLLSVRQAATPLLAVLLVSLNIKTLSTYCKIKSLDMAAELECIMIHQAMSTVAYILTGPSTAGRLA